MLKRQRPSSPIPIPPETLEEDSSAGGLYEPDTKRRRYFAPPTFNEHHQSNGGDGDGTDSDDSEILNEDRRKDHFRRKREWQAAAGVYKDANSLLHDLHAEQRHRIIFASHSSSSPSPSSSAMPSHWQNSTLPKSHTAMQTHRTNKDFHFSEHPEIDYEYMQENQSEQVEVNLVTQRYEESNRLLRDLFLNRRKEVHGQYPS